MKILIYIAFLTLSGFAVRAQSGKIILDPVKESMYAPFLYSRHGGAEGLAEFKKDHKYDYLKEMWYYTESFYIKADHIKEGIKMDPAMIDVTRFEFQRKENEEVIIMLGGFRDALVLLPKNKLIYSPAQ